MSADIAVLFGYLPMLVQLQRLASTYVIEKKMYDHEVKIWSTGFDAWKDSGGGDTEHLRG